MWPGVLVGLSYDLSEVMAAALLIATVLALRRSRWTFATVTLTASVMTRETAVIMAGAVVLAALSTRVGSRSDARWWGRGPVPPVSVGLVPIGAMVGWHLVLSWWFAGDEVDFRYPTEIILLGFVLMLDLAPGSAPSWPRCSGSCS
ncbi:hypothetical protein [Iamia sp.]|uniref:hypothetical protein n=1 Tax=Iamia sp. TaxID=2722710 RepID=UPI002C31F409|nr:hypothetical protein [Iamia sp.]HXH57373.1 hypothetical protein [Iamia sp.]